MTSIASYQSNLFISNRQIEQIQVETLFQMGRASYIKEQRDFNELLNEAEYRFPDGRVEIFIQEENKTHRKLNFHIVLEPQEAIFSINHFIEKDLLEH